MLKERKECDNSTVLTCCVVVCGAVKLDWLKYHSDERVNQNTAKLQAIKSKQRANDNKQSQVIMLCYYTVSDPFYIVCSVDTILCLQFSICICFNVLCPSSCTEMYRTNKTSEEIEIKSVSIHTSVEVGAVSILCLLLLRHNPNLYIPTSDMSPCLSLDWNWRKTVGRCRRVKIMWISKLPLQIKPVNHPAIYDAPHYT